MTRDDLIRLIRISLHEVLLLDLVAYYKLLNRVSDLGQLRRTDLRYLLALILTERESALTQNRSRLLMEAKARRSELENRLRVLVNQASEITGFTPALDMDKLDQYTEVDLQREVTWLLTLLRTPR